MILRTAALASILLLALAARAADPPATASAASSSAIYQQAVDQYLACKWDDLERTLSQNRAALAQLTPEQTADLDYLKQSVAESRPAWWPYIKEGKRYAFRATLWSRPLAAIYDPSIKSNVNLQSANGKLTLLVNWPATDMDNPAHAEHGFSKADLTSLGLWGILESGRVWATLGPEKLVNLSELQKAELQQYLQFRSTLGGIYYGTPRARRWGCFLALDVLTDHYATNAGLAYRKPVAAMLIAEIVAHPDHYPSLRLPPAATTEKEFGIALLRQFERTTLTLAEDRFLREAVKDFANANGNAILNAGIVTLPSKLTASLELKADIPLAQAREAWLHAPHHAATTAPKAP
jgi:hypothetical protein